MLAQVKTMLLTREALTVSGSPQNSIRHGREILPAALLLVPVLWCPTVGIHRAVRGPPPWGGSCRCPFHRSQCKRMELAGDTMILAAACTAYGGDLGARRCSAVCCLGLRLVQHKPSAYASL